MSSCLCAGACGAGGACAACGAGEGSRGTLSGDDAPGAAPEPGLVLGADDCCVPT